VNRYGKNKLLASYSLNYPNLDNAIYAYNKEGLTESILTDNGRRIHSFVYRKNLLDTYEHYDGFSLLEKRDFVYNEQDALIGFKEAGRNGNRVQNYVIKYSYFE
jgi:hypothetical protein